MEILQQKFLFVMPEFLQIQDFIANNVYLVII